MTSRKPRVASGRRKKKDLKRRASGMYCEYAAIRSVLVVGAARARMGSGVCARYEAKVSYEPCREKCGVSGIINRELRYVLWATRARVVRKWCGMRYAWRM